MQMREKYELLWNNSAFIRWKEQKVAVILWSFLQKKKSFILLEQNPGFGSRGRRAGSELLKLTSQFRLCVWKTFPLQFHSHVNILSSLPWFSLNEIFFLIPSMQSVENQYARQESINLPVETFLCWITDFCEGLAPGWQTHLRPRGLNANDLIPHPSWHWGSHCHHWGAKGDNVQKTHRLIPQYT